MRYCSVFGLILSLVQSFGPAAFADPILTETARLTLSARGDWFGGFSGMEVSSDGQTVRIISDNGVLLTGTFTRVDGKLTKFTPVSTVQITNQDGAEMSGTGGDSEGLAQALDERLWTSLEHDHRVLRIDPTTGTTTPLARHPDFATFSDNSGLEMLAATPDGTLFAIPERSGALSRPFKIYRYQNNMWDIAAQLPRNPPFLIVGGDLEGECLLYLLERGITPLGFRSRMQRVDLCAMPLTRDILFTSWPGQYDNLEALTLWRDPQGDLRLLAISDDNYLRIQRTELVEFILQE